MVQIFERYVTKFAPRKALKLITGETLTFDRRVVLHRVGARLVSGVKSSLIRRDGLRFTFDFRFFREGFEHHDLKNNFFKSIEEQLLYIKVLWFRGGLVLKARRLLYHSTLG